MKDLSGKIVGVVGAAKSGQAAARLSRHHGARVRISENGPEVTIDPEFLAWAREEGVTFEFNGHTKDFVEGCDLLVISPGVRADAPPILWARERKIPVWGEIELAFRFCRKPVIAITGSNGKTTVSTLIARFIDASGQKACLCGNVGQPFSEFVLRAEQPDFFVIEISSFQLETIETFRPSIGVFLNFSQNHLDRHKDLDEYFAAKCRIFMNQDENDYAVLNQKDEWVQRAGRAVRSQKIFFNENRPGEYAIRNPNHSAALAVAEILDLPRAVCLDVLRDFPGVEHRMERVRVLDGVEYINDSKATTVEAGKWAIESVDKPIVMIAGGRDKNLDFSVLRPIVAKKVKAMVLFGECREKLRHAFAGAVNLLEGQSLEDAVNLARGAARAGDTVMLVPMCTSYDMFKNFEERGKAFKTIVRGLQ